MKMFRCLVLFIWLSFNIHCFSCVKVVTKLGNVDGIDYLLENGKTIFAFLGVPFARPPVEEYRFEEPQPVQKWYGTWMAKTSSSACLKLHESGALKGTEDCLYLDIYTPTVSRKSGLPVMVYIHGGAFRIGKGGLHTAKHIMNDTNFIFVSINYRLGPFGFLSTEDSHVPGNNGLKDQAMALKWIQENVESFGGDENKVTIVGHSAGGASVQLHYLSPWSQGLFRNGISASGTALNPWALTESPLKKARLLAESVGCPTTSSLLMVRCLKQRPGVNFFRNFSSIFMPWHDNPITPFGPVIERAGSRPFLNEHPYELLAKGRVQDKPFLLSVTTEEGLFPGIYFIENETSLIDIEKSWNTIAPYLLDYKDTVSSEKLNSVSEAVRKFYFGSEKHISNETNIIIKMLSERLFNSGIGEAALLQASAMKSPVFLFSIGFMFNSSFTDRYTKTKYGVSHADDIINILQVPFGRETADKAMAHMLKNVWISFMNDGRPSVGKDMVWDPVTGSCKDSIRYLNIVSLENISMSEESGFGNQQFWDSLGLYENSYYYNNSEMIYSNGNSLTITFFIIFPSVLAMMVTQSQCS